MNEAKLNDPPATCESYVIAQDETDRVCGLVSYCGATEADAAAMVKHYGDPAEHRFERVPFVPQERDVRFLLLQVRWELADGMPTSLVQLPRQLRGAWHGIAKADGPWCLSRGEAFEEAAKRNAESSILASEELHRSGAAPDSIAWAVAAELAEPLRSLLGGTAEGSETGFILVSRIVNFPARLVVPTEAESRKFRLGAE